MLTRVHVDNYKCLTNFDLRLDKLTLLVGANGCGKSAVFEVMGKLHDFACDSHVDKLFFAEDLTRWTRKREQRFELEFSTDGGVFIYKLVIEQKPDERGAEVTKERLVHDGKPVLSSSDRKLQLYRDDDSEGDAYPFGPHRSALATESDARLYSRLHRFRDLLSNFQTLSLAPSRIESGSEARHSYSFDKLSDGQRALIVLYSLVFATVPDSGSPDDTGNLPRTLFLDEPDNYVTLPELQPWLAELEDGAGDTLPQVVLISHHPEAIDFLTDSTVWLAREPESHTRIVEPTNDTGLRMSEVYARGWAP